MNAKRQGSRPPAPMGYPSVQALIDSEDFESVNAAFASAYDQLSDLSRKKSGLRRGREAKKAMKAMELTMELLRELLSLKYRLQEQHSSKKPSGK